MLDKEYQANTWYREGSLVFTLRETKGPKNKTVLVNDTTIKVECRHRPDEEEDQIAEQVLQALRNKPVVPTWIPVEDVQATEGQFAVGVAKDGTMGPVYYRCATEWQPTNRWFSYASSQEVELTHVIVKFPAPPVGQEQEGGSDAL